MYSVVGFFTICSISLFVCDQRPVLCREHLSRLLADDDLPPGLDRLHVGAVAGGGVAAVKLGVVGAAQGDDAEPGFLWVF